MTSRRLSTAVLNIWGRLLIGLGLLTLLFVGCIYQTDFGTYQEGEELLGGETTVFEVSRNAFGYSARNLSFDRRSSFFVGNSFFNQNWVTAPASTSNRDGIGPFFNARSCSSCHLRDGRGRPPNPAEGTLNSLVLQISVSDSGAHGGPEPSPTYGGGFSPLAVPGLEPEGKVEVSYDTLNGQFADGTPYTLRQPRYQLTSPQGQPVDSTLQFSPRVAPHMVGMGLLEAIPQQAIHSLADPKDQDNNGISGRANKVWSAYHQKMMLGRLGWKANQPTVPDQVVAAFNSDMGLTTSYRPKEDCTQTQQGCLEQPSGGDPDVEVNDTIVDKVSFYVRTLAVPARRNAKDATVLKGKRLFHQAGCASCHTPRFKTGTLENFPELSNQTIRPYTDLLLHDMGKGLADHRGDYKASGREWRTPPLWGIGLIETVNGHTTFLHDGRARSLMEAILWHGGEAAAARDRVRQMPKADRQALITFLNSL